MLYDKTMIAIELYFVLGVSVLASIWALALVSGNTIDGKTSALSVTAWPIMICIYWPAIIPLAVIGPAMVLLFFAGVLAG